MRLASALPFVLLAACSGEQSSSSSSLTRDPGECSDREVHVIGLEETATSTATILLSRPGKHLLVLSAHEPTSWNVEVQSGATLDGVYAVGYYPQKVTANVPTRINTESKVEGGAFATGYKYPDANTDALLKLASIRTALHATSFHGCYSASKWTISENMLVTSNCSDGGYTQYDAVTDCDGDNACGEDTDGDGQSDGSLY